MEAIVLSPRELHHLHPINLGFSSIKSTSSVRLCNRPKHSFVWPQSGRPKLRSQTNLRSSAPDSVSEVRRDEEKSPSVSPVYTPTPPNRDLRTPHSGYHFDGTARKFFEGWYFKVSIPETKQSFCFMYTVENPAFRRKLSPWEVAEHGPRFTGVGAQILGAYDKYICQFSEESQNFWGSRHELSLGNTFTAEKGQTPPNKDFPPQEFNRRVVEGFQVTPLWNQGFICDDGRSDYVDVVKAARWEYSTRPVFGWGDVGSKQKSTAGWLAAFPVFEPHWQICMAGGLSTGWIEWDGERFEFENAPSYCEKNWGGAFPRKWFWVQSNVFEGATGEVALTAAGGYRQIPGLTETFENAALVGVHYGGKFYEFVPWNGVVSWEIAPWGHWHLAGENNTHMVELEATTQHSGTTLRAPTSEAGLAPVCKDTCFAVLKLQIWERKFDGSKGKIILDVTSDMAAAEVGGGPWFNTWKGKTATPELVRQALNVPVDVEGFFNLAPFFKPPATWQQRRLEVDHGSTLGRERLLRQALNVPVDVEGFFNLAPFFKPPGTTTQLLLSFFDMEGVVHYGIAGNANPSLNVGDVAVPQYWSHTALWNWQDLELEGCLDSTTCLSTTPKVYTVDNGTSASIYLDNAAYRGFIYRKFDISLVDMESASVALLCFQQTVPFIANWALSSPAVALPATTRLTPSSPSLAANNSIAVVLAFVNNF